MLHVLLTQMSSLKGLHSHVLLGDSGPYLNAALQLFKDQIVLTNIFTVVAVGFGMCTFIRQLKRE